MCNKKNSIINKDLCISFNANKKKILLILLSLKSEGALVLAQQFQLLVETISLNLLFLQHYDFNNKTGISQVKKYVSVKNILSIYIRHLRSQKTRMNQNQSLKTCIHNLKSRKISEKQKQLRLQKTIYHAKVIITANLPSCLYLYHLQFKVFAWSS